MEKIIGNTVGVPNPQSDWNQTDVRKADYIKNKPDVSGVMDEVNGLHSSVMGIQNDINDINESNGRIQDRVASVEENVLNINSYIENEVDGIVEELSAHIIHIENPHNVTAEQIGASSLSRINTFTEENIFTSIVRINGAFEGNHDTYVSSLDGQKRYNVFEELAKIESINGVSLSEDNTFTGDNTFNILRANEIQTQGIEYQWGVAHQGLSVTEYLTVSGQAEFYNDIKVKGVNVAEELAKIGDFETALDTAIALCDTYINGGAE